MSNKDQKKDQDQKNGNGRSPQVGALLRASRLRVGEDLRNVSDILCIRYLYLEAIEECRYGDLPGNTYAVGFIRSYAEHLGLDGDEVVRRYRVEQSGQKSATDLAFPTPVPDSGVPKGAIVFIGVLIALLVYGGWYVTTTDESILSDLISPVPDHLKHLVTNDDAAGGSPGDAKPDDAAATQSETAPPEITEKATAEIEKVVRETTAAAEQMANDAGAAAQRAADSTGEAVTETAETVTKAVNEGAVAVVEKVQPTTETASDAATAAPSAPTVMPNEAPVTPVNSPAIEVATPTATSSETSASNAESPAAAATETASAAAQSKTPAPLSEAASPAAPAVEAASTPQSETVEAKPLTEGESPSAQPDQKPATAEVTAEDLNALVLRQATGVSDQTSTPAPPEPASLASGDVAQTTGIAIRATSSSWVEIRNPASGDIIFTGLMNAGNVFNVPDTEGLTLDTGNAGALEISVDGTTVPQIGGIGAVRKNVALDADRLKAGTAVSR